jgi:hypothetical protein
MHIGIFFGEGDLSPLESILLSFVEQICLGTSQVDNLRTSVTLKILNDIVTTKEPLIIINGEIPQFEKINY